MKLKDLCLRLSQSLPASYKETSFYTYVQNAFKKYNKELEKICEEDYKTLLTESKYSMNEPYTKRRFINLIVAIEKTCLRILQYSFKGDLLNASLLLKRLLTKTTYTQRKLVEPYCNYFQMSYKIPLKFFRCRDVKIGSEHPKDFWHVPFEMRSRASYSRFNLSAYPCLYLSDSMECACTELGDLKSGYERWMQSFTHRKNSGTLLFLNLSMPTGEEICNYDTFSLLITFPIALLCLTKVKCNGMYHEEYLFSQLFLHVLFMHDNDYLHGFQGICYSSTKYFGGRNFVIPASYDGLNPQLEGCSQTILNLFEPLGQPQLIAVNRNDNGKHRKHQ